jgi:MFS family permease
LRWAIYAEQQFTREDLIIALASSKKEVRKKGDILLNHHYPALTNHNFRIFWFGQFLSLIGTWMQTTVQPFLAYRLTDQALFIGAVGFATTAPALLFILPGGVLFERLNKRRVVLVMQIVMMLQAFMLAFLTLTGLLNIWLLLLAAFILGIANALEITARNTMIVELVERENLANAVALNAATFNAARVIGPLLTTPVLLFAFGPGEGWIFLINGLSYLFVILGLLHIQTKPVQGSIPENPVRWQDFLEGQRYIRKTSLISLLIMMLVIPSIAGFPFVQLLPVFAQETLRQAGDTTSIAATRHSFMMAAQGIGALAASLFLTYSGAIQRKGRSLMTGQLLFVVALFGLGLAWHPVQAYPLVALMGLGMVLQIGLSNTIIQVTVPDHLRARVISTYIWIVHGTAPLGSLFLGWFIQATGPRFAIILGSVVCLMVYLIIHCKHPDIRRISS